MSVSKVYMGHHHPFRLIPPTPKSFAGEAYDSIHQLCIFLLNSFNLPPDKALVVHILSHDFPFQFVGVVTVTHHSAIFSLIWPDLGGEELQKELTTLNVSTLSEKIGIFVEHLASLLSLDMASEKRIDRLAVKVGENLFNFIQSFYGVDGSKLTVPMDILDRWFKKFQEWAKRDPEYLKGFAT
ncbi:unnamed protein product [Lactuca virosa]|uniref:Hikeshi-like domain-containing protein n=1 Tax=Lactuca virosa TaxID=75947 RepID=A0AAU9LH31_9ASTR|nr:unnamed protein product [Lactuca virosa]